MKHIFVTLTALSLMLVSCGKDNEIQEIKEANSANTTEVPTESKTKITMSAFADPSFDNKLYPSLVYALAYLDNSKNNSSSSDDNNDGFFNLNITSNKDVDVKLVIEGNKFTDETQQNISLKKGENLIKIEINNLQWRYSDFKYITSSGFEFFNFKIKDIEDTWVELGRASLKMEYRGINECVFLAKEDDKYIPLYNLFAAYVNEDSPVIDNFLSETIHNTNNPFVRNGFLRTWDGYQSDNAHIQIGAIVRQLHLKGMVYSSITTTSNSRKNIYSQYVRFIEDSLRLQQANCVDGSVLLASILTKIDLNCYLITIPGHMYLAVDIDNNNTPDMFIETTIIGTDPANAIGFIHQSPRVLADIEHIKNGDSGYGIVSIKEVRKLLKPIQ